MNAAEFSTKLRAWSAKYPSQEIAAAELGVPYATLLGWLGVPWHVNLCRAGRRALTMPETVALALGTPRAGSLCSDHRPSHAPVCPAPTDR